MKPNNQPPTNTTTNNNKSSPSPFNRYMNSQRPRGGRGRGRGRGRYFPPPRQFFPGQRIALPLAYQTPPQPPPRGGGRGGGVGVVPRGRIRARTSRGRGIIRGGGRHTHVLPRVTVPPQIRTPIPPPIYQNPPYIPRNDPYYVGRGSNPIFDRQRFPPPQRPGTVSPPPPRNVNGMREAYRPRINTTSSLSPREQGPLPVNIKMEKKNLKIQTNMKKRYITNLSSSGTPNSSNTPKSPLRPGLSQITTIRKVLDDENNEKLKNLNEKYSNNREAYNKLLDEHINILLESSKLDIKIKMKEAEILQDEKNLKVYEKNTLYLKEFDEY